MAILDKINGPKRGSFSPDDGTDRGPSIMRSGLGFIIEVAKIVIISLAIIIPVRYFLIQPFYVKGASMEDTFFDNEYLMIDEISYRFSEPKRGDIVVFRYPQNPSQFFIKRVIGLPGEKVEVRNGHVIISNDSYPRGQVLQEQAYLGEDAFTSGNEFVQLEKNQFYVMGDNREQSLDSRRIGPIDKSAIVGRTWLRAWPFSKWRVFSPLDYNI